MFYIRFVPLALPLLILPLLPAEAAASAQGPTDAAQFARKVMKVIDLAHENSVREVNRRDMVAWAVEGLYQHQKAQIPLTIQERLKQVKATEQEELLALLRDARAGLGDREALAEDRDLKHAADFMLRRLDPHAGFVTEVDRFRTQGTPSLSIGVRLALDASGKWPQVVTPLKDGPAYKAGIKTGDLITHITRTTDFRGNPLPNPQTTATEGLPLAEVMKRLLAPAGNKVELMIRREGEKQPLKQLVTHGYSEIETVLGARRRPDDSWDYFLDAGSKIGYVRLTQFGRKTAGDLNRALEELARAGFQGLILDLRSNPGGLLQSAIDVADLFLNDVEIVAIHTRKGREMSFTGKREGSYLNFPMVCLIDGTSASSSEIVAAALQDHGRALVLGERSQGKGSAQNIQPLLDGYQVKLTVAVFITPKGRKLDIIPYAGRDENEWGVLPDPGHEVKLPPAERGALTTHLNNLDIIPRRDLPAKDDAPAFRDRQRELAVEHLRAQLRKR